MKKSWGRELAIFISMVPLALSMVGIDLNAGDQQALNTHTTSIISALAGLAALYSKIVGMWHNKK